MNPGIIYIGRRVNGSAVVQAFKDGEKEILFKGLRGLIIGYSYEYNGEGKISSHPKRLDFPAKVAAEWEAQDALAEDFLATRRAEERLKRNSRPAYRNAVESLKPLLRGLDIYDKRALVSKLIEDAKD